MECKLITLVSVFFIAFLSQGCGYLDNDEVEYQHEILRNIIIQKRENDQAVNLIFVEVNDVSAIVINDISKIYFDSSTKKIFVEAYQVGINRDYFLVDILNPLAKYVSEGTRTKEISKQYFDEKTKRLSSKWEFKKL